MPRTMYDNPGPTDGMSSDMDDLYDEGGEDESREPVDQEIQEDASNIALVPLNVLQGPKGHEVKEGDEIVVQVVAIHGDEAEVKYAPERGGGGSETETEPGGVDDYSKEFEEMSAAKE